MRRQNPPQSSLDQARALEKYLNPTAIAIIYALFATASFVFIALLFLVLVYGYGMSPTPMATSAFATLALAPFVLVLLAFRLRPGDPLSLSIRSLADERRKPIRVAGDHIGYKVLMMTGETLCVNLSFFYPAKNGTPELRERLKAFVRTALQQHCTTCSELPSEREIEKTVDDTLAIIAAEHNIPVLYSEVRDMHKIRDRYSKFDDLTPWEYLGTGTRGKN